MTAMPGGGDSRPIPLEPTATGYKIRAADLTRPIRQWFTAKTTAEKLDLVFQNIADEDGDVERVHHLGSRDWLVFWSKAVVR